MILNCANLLAFEQPRLCLLFLVWNASQSEKKSHFKHFVRFQEQSRISCYFHLGKSYMYENQVVKHFFKDLT